MRRTGILLTLGIILGTAAVAGCRARPEVTPNPAPPTPVVRAGENGSGGTLEQQAQLSDRFPLSATAEEVDTVALDDSQCIACHTDEGAVKALAEEPEEEEKLSEGEG
jgi:mono/diheme cytochrome c family protein